MVNTFSVRMHDNEMKDLVTLQSKIQAMYGYPVKINRGDAIKWAVKFSLDHLIDKNDSVT